MDFTAGIETYSTMDLSSTTTTTTMRQRTEKSSQLETTKSTSNINEILEEKEHLLALKKTQQKLIHEETSKIVLWRQPINTIHYCLLELIYLIHHNFKYIITFRKSLCISSILLLSFLFIYKTEGSHQIRIQAIQSLFLWASYWLGLGIASSIGLGTGLHTFLLYLGPFIAQVTLAAYECGSIKFPRPPYPHEIICPSSSNETNLLETGPISFWNILWKVKLEAFFWGLGTALGELPPYFMARAARLSKNETTDDEELIEFQQLLLDAKLNKTRHLTLFERLRYSVYCLIERIGFFGILLCASIPNPLFDLAGITCGYFLISFSRFFFATIIGKAIIKMSIQTIFIIFLFSEHHVERIIRWMKHIPYYGRLLQTPFKDWLHEQKDKMHRKSNNNLTGSITKVSMLSRIFDLFVAAMIGYFIISIINSLAQRYYKRTRTIQCK
ncbi:unnamed protein product [Adineta steineri]|uniref:Vacuole membrane protein 1 n=1 Tax=Adineta steineri TaxID=433720 RepID=A0A819Q6T1_9BILA|nr:unnamed protein product [Adineta steineri]